MTEQLNETKRPMTKRVLKRICIALVVLLVASAVMVGAGSADTVQVSTQEALNQNITDATGPRTIYLADGTYTLPTIDNANDAKDITIKGTKSVVIDISTGVTMSASNITFDGVAVKFDNGDTYKGLWHTTKVVYKDCTISGKQFLYAKHVEFTNCTLVNSADYCVWTYTAENVIFTDCTFNTGGKAIYVHNEKTIDSFESHITLNNCVFNDDGTLNTVKAAVETGVSDFDLQYGKAKNTETSNKYYITFNGCTVNGFAINNEGINTDTEFYGNKHSMSEDTHLFVTINHKVTWQNYDHSEIYNESVLDGKMPVYNGATPTKPADDTYKYEFIGWNPDLQPVTNSITYTAQFKAIEIPTKDDDSASQGSSVWLTGPAYSIYTSHVENGGSAYFSENSPIFKVTMPETYTGDVTITTYSDAESPEGKNVHLKADIKVEPAMSFGDIATIHFKLPLFLIQQNGFEAADVCLYHGNGDWTKLPTIYTVVGDTVYYESQTDSFSPFAIVFEENAATPKDAPSTPAPTTTETTSPGFGVIAVMAGLGAVAVLRRR